MLSVIFILTLSYSQAQNKKSFLKISPGITIPKNGEAFFNGYLSVGFAGKFIAFGPSFGYLKFPKDSKPIVPTGGELLFTNLRGDKVAPYFSVGMYYPNYNVKNSSSSSNVIVQSTIKGTLQYKAGAGIALPMTKGKKIILSGSYMPINFKSNSSVTIITPGQPSRTSVNNTSSTSDLFSISVEIIL